MSQPNVTPWPGDRPPSHDDLDRLMRDEGLIPRWWSNGPGDRFAAHDHGHHKVLYCARGSITFRTDSGELSLAPGDRLDLPPRTRHFAIVGESGVECVEAAR